MTDGQDIRDARQRAGLTQAEFAGLVGVSQRTIGNWERGETVSHNRIARIREVLAGHWKDDDPDQVGLASASDVELLAEIARRFARTQKEARHAAQAENQTSSGEDVQGARDRAPIDLAQARKVKDDPAAFGDQPRQGDLDQGKLQPPPAPEKSAAWRTRNRGKEIRDDHDETARLQNVEIDIASKRFADGRSSMWGLPH